MGMFDRIYVTCPKCKNRVECQSKNGPCNLDEYELEDAPTEVVLGITDGNGYTYCNTCEQDLYIKRPTGWQIALVGAEEEETYD